MITWSEQPIEAANLYNPAFVGELIRRATTSYVTESKMAMPLVLAFIVAPLVLYPDSRQTLRGHRFSHLHNWISNNPSVRIRLAERSRELAPYVRLGIAFAMAQKSLTVDENGGIKPVRRQSRPGALPTVDSSEWFDASRTFGRLFARAASVSNIFLMLGLEL